jgi:hypothetical protein
VSNPPDPLAACTAVLFTVPREVASRLEGFLRANDIACRIRQNEMTPDQVAEQVLRQAQPGAARVLDTPFVGRMVRSRLRKDLKAEITVTGSSMPAMFDVLVRPEDLPTAATAGHGADPWAREPDGAEPASAVLGDVPPTDAPDTVLCERPWDRAWEIVSLLGEQGIQAAILPNEESTTAPSIDSGMFRVGVRAHDLERAQGLIES